MTAAPRVADEPPGFPAFDCFTASFGTVVKLLGCDPVVLGERWGHRWTGAVPVKSPIDPLAIESRDAGELLADWYGLRTDRAEHESPAAAWRHILAETARNHPVIVAVDSFHLPHNPHHRQLHLPHRLVVLEVTADGTRVIDSYQGAAFAGRMDTETLRSAIAAVGRHADSTYDDRAACNTITVCGEPSAGPVLTAEKLTAALRAAVSAQTDDGDQSRGGPALGRGIRELRGFQAEGSLTTPGFVEVLAWLGEVASQRAINGAFLAEAGRVTGSAALTEASDHAKATARHWLTGRNLFYLRANRTRAVPGRLIDKLDELRVADERLTLLVAKALDEST